MKTLQQLEQDDTEGFRNPEQTAAQYRKLPPQTLGFGAGTYPECFRLPTEAELNSMTWFRNPKELT
jgi:hypothetical protein